MRGAVSLPELEWELSEEGQEGGRVDAELLRRQSLQQLSEEGEEEGDGASAHGGGGWKDGREGGQQSRRRLLAHQRYRGGANELPGLASFAGRGVEMRLKEEEQQPLQIRGQEGGQCVDQRPDHHQRRQTHGGMSGGGGGG